MRLTIVVLAVLVGVSGGLAAEDTVNDAPFLLPTPEGWRTETIPFPLDFAPELEYEGVEELRFAPGMFTEDADDFWTYAFVWWIPIESVIESGRLATDLEAYFSGLAGAVAPGKGFDLARAIFDVEFEEANVAAGAVLTGRAAIFEPFVTGKNVALNIRVKEIECGDKGHRAVIFELSPQPFSHHVWSTLERIRDGFLCRD